MNQIIKGDDIMVFDANGRSLALATSHTLSLSADTTEVNTKDHGIWGSTEANKINWTVSSENMYSEASYNDLVDIMLARTAVKIYMGRKLQTGTGTVDEDGVTPTSGTATQKTWTRKAAGVYSGNALITSIDLNAPSGDNATFSVTFQGVGELSRTTE